MTCFIDTSLLLLLDITCGPSGLWFCLQALMSVLSVNKTIPVYFYTINVFNIDTFFGSTFVQTKYVFLQRYHNVNI